MNISEAEQIKLNLEKSERNLKTANEILKDLQEQKAKRDNPNILKEENEDLDITHRLCIEDIKHYNENILQLQKEQKLNEDIILKLKKENEKLKKEKNVPDNNNNNKNSKAYGEFVLNMKDLCKKLGFKLLKKDQNPPQENIIKDNKEGKKINLDKIKKTKEDFDKTLKELKTKSNQFNNKIRGQNITVNEYRKYLNEVYQFMSTFRERISVSMNNARNNNNANLEEMNKLFESISIEMFELDDIILRNNNIFGSNVENIIADIQTNIDNLDKNENQIEENFNNICALIKQKIDEINIIFSEVEKNKDSFDSKNRNVEGEIKKLKDLHKNNGRKGNNNINNNINNPNNIRNNNINDNPNNINNNQNRNNNQNINNSRRRWIIGQSFLFKVKDEATKLDLLKTANLFTENSQNLSDDNFGFGAKLIRKNYHEICYVYDDYDICDVYYDLVAVGLSENSFFPTCNQSFPFDKTIEIESLLIDGVPSQYRNNFLGIEVDINLKNFESKKIHIKYKVKKNLSFLSQGQLEQRNIYRTETYGLEGNLEGQMAKFSLILKGSFDIVNFEDYFLMRNKNNTDEVEYMWGGRVPYGGKMTKIMFSKKEATWSFNLSVDITSFYQLRNTKYCLPIEFVGGNNEIININPTSPQSSNIIIDEENRKYIVEFINTRYNRAQFTLKGKLKNKCKGEWEVDLTDEEIEKNMPREDVLAKEQLKIIAKKIIEEFDNIHRDDDFEYLDYMKIGMWVNENIEYDINYSGKIQLTAMDIYNMRRGVCHHITRLSNALLYSLGYKVMYLCGYSCQNCREFKTSFGHCWSLIRLENRKWYPFDATWGIYTGKLPVGHIFSTYFQVFGQLNSTDFAMLGTLQMEGKYLN